MPIYPTPKSYRRLGIVQQVGVELCLDEIFAVSPRHAILRSTGKPSRWFVYVPETGENLVSYKRSKNNPYKNFRPKLFNNG